MDISLIQQVTAITGIASFILTMVVISLYFIYDGSPPAKNVLLRNYLNLFILVGLLIFISGFQYVATEFSPGYAWIGGLTQLFGFAFIVMTFTAQSFESASVLGKTKRIDPTLVGSGAEGSIVIYGPVARMLTAFTLLFAGVLILGTEIVAPWIAWVAFATAAFHIVLTPTLFSGSEPSRFYSINGWSIPVAGGLLLAWVLITSIALLVA